MSRPFSLGILVGRFQCLHSGHEDMIRTAIALCDRVGVFVGSSQESGTFHNPFSYDTRERLLRLLFDNRIDVFPLPDIGVGNNSTWGEYVLENVKAHYNRLPDLQVSGKESRRTGWFEGIPAVNIAELYIPKTIEISATQMRQFFVYDDRKGWEKYTNPVLWGEYPFLREQVLAAQDKLHTASL